MAESNFVLDSYVNISDDTYDTGILNGFIYITRTTRRIRQR